MEDRSEEIATMLQQTRNGLLKWEVRSRDENGKPDGWRTTTPDGRPYSIGMGQSLMDEPVEGEVEGVFVRDGDPGRELYQLVASMFSD